MSTLENLIENPDEWEDPNDVERKTRKYKARRNTDTKAISKIDRNTATLKRYANNS